MSTNTTNYGWILPGVNDPVDSNIWGTQLNSNLTSQDTIVKDISNIANSGQNLVGDLKATARSTAPALWLFANGAAVSRSTYAALFTAIGTTYGIGDGTTTFNLPDAGGRVLAGKESVATRLTSAVSGVDGATLGSSGGDQRVQTHTHTASVTDPGHVHTQNFGGSGGTVIAAGSASGVINTYPNNSATTGITVSNASFGAGSSQNVQPTLVVNWLIYAGV